ncbi:hypothetical protein TorRG33x02_006440 [Trema orientale]|uniref:Uncharacterized protein n=1 Tax=Trema orientale TaxID=63057 RepID=A0A2P5G0A3_TREOI|nr:hypothetical protein TorRG33x02_006440 [Trema orientale]
MENRGTVKIMGTTTNKSGEVEEEVVVLSSAAACKTERASNWPTLLTRVLASDFFSLVFGQRLAAKEKLESFVER